MTWTLFFQALWGFILLSFVGTVIMSIGWTALMFVFKVFSKELKG